MTRQIKFRAWDIEAKKMEDVGAIDWGGDGTVVTCNTETKKHYVMPESWGQDFVLMQYTGLKDKNGKEIYEGDILEFTDKWEWYKGKYAIPMMFANADKKKVLKAEYDAEPMYRRAVSFDPFNGYNLSSSDLQYYMEVIGNIYENPELLKHD